MNSSIIYKNILLYRTIMTILYLGHYKKRFKDVINLLDNKDKSVVELCFGDIFIAKHCAKNNIKWKGYDLSTYFINYATKLGFDAEYTDVLKNKELLKADICIIIGSLYHFSNEIEKFLLILLSLSPKIIISEPIKNLTNSNKLFKYFANKLTNAGKGEENFRYTKDTIIGVLNKYSIKLNFSYKIINENRDLLILITHD